METPRIHSGIYEVTQSNSLWPKGTYLRLILEAESLSPCFMAINATPVAGHLHISKVKLVQTFDQERITELESRIKELEEQVTFLQTGQKPKPKYKLDDLVKLEVPVARITSIATDSMVTIRPMHADKRRYITLHPDLLTPIEWYKTGEIKTT